MSKTPLPAQLDESFLERVLESFRSAAAWEFAIYPEIFFDCIPLPLSPQEKGRYDRALARAFWREGQHGGFW